MLLKHLGLQFSSETDHDVYNAHARILKSARGLQVGVFLLGRVLAGRRTVEQRCRSVPHVGRLCILVSLRPYYVSLIVCDPERAASSFWRSIGLGLAGCGRDCEREGQSGVQYRVEVL